MIVNHHLLLANNLSSVNSLLFIASSPLTTTCYTNHSIIICLLILCSFLLLIIPSIQLFITIVNHLLSLICHHQLCYFLLTVKNVQNKIATHCLPLPIPLWVIWFVHWNRKQNEKFSRIFGSLSNWNIISFEFFWFIYHYRTNGLS